MLLSALAAAAAPCPLLPPATTRAATALCQDLKANARELTTEAFYVQEGSITS
jgi:hypothetical protein